MKGTGLSVPLVYLSFPGLRICRTTNLRCYGENQGRVSCGGEHHGHIILRGTFQNNQGRMMGFTVAYRPVAPLSPKLRRV